MTKMLLVVGCLISLIGVLAAKPLREEKAPEVSIPIDAEQAKKATAVLRVKLDRHLGGESGVEWYRVRVLKVLKEAAGVKFEETLDVMTYNKNFGRANPNVPGVPPEECTLYLEPARGSKLWALLGGQASTGISHVAKAASK